MFLPTALVFVAGAAAFAATEVKPIPPDREFAARLDEYVKLKQQVTKGLADPPPKSDPKVIETRKNATAQAISDARAGAKPGDLFSPAVATQIKATIRSETKGTGGKAAKGAAQAGNPVAEGTPFTPKVNAVYPGTAPLSTVPATILLRLPQLPKDLEYRFVGKTLILYDTDARLIVDLLPNAMP